jgi:DNA-binding response OmpR family regulator
MEKGTLLVWEDPQSTQIDFSQTLNSAFLRILPASDLKTCFKWLEERVPIDMLVLNLGKKASARIKEYQQLKKRPEMWDLPTLVIANREDLIERQEFLKNCEDFVLEKTTPQEILIRTLKLLRSSSHHSKLNSQKLYFGKIHLYPKLFRAEREGKDLKLTPLEFHLLMYFFKHRERVLGREELLKQVWGYGDLSYTRTVDTFIKRLRYKLGKEEHLIETLRGIGYRMKED